MSEDHDQTKPDDAIVRAKADILELSKKINMIGTEIVRLQSQQNQMERQHERIQAFVEMYERYTGPSAPQGDHGSPPSTGDIKRPIARPVERKPDGTPPMSEMIIAAIRAANEGGAKGLEPRDMTSYIRNHWWPGVTGESVGPIAWRMARLGQLKKTGRLYRLP